MYPCPKCGNPIRFGEKFCGNCGMGFTWQTQQQTPPQYQQAPPNVYRQTPNYPYQNYQQSPGWGQPPPPPAWGPPQQPQSWGPPYQQPQGFYGYGNYVPKKSSSSGLIVLFVILAVVVLSIGGIGIATNGKFNIMPSASSGATSSGNQPTSSTNNPSSTQTPPSAPAKTTVSADNLITAYKTDKTAAEATYKGKSVTFTGKVAGYSIAALSVTLKGDTATDFVIKCIFSQGDSSAILNLEPDQSLTVAGTVGDFNSAEITVNNCTFVK